MWESSLAAVMLRRVAASRPSRDVWPSFSIPWSPAAGFSAIADAMVGVFGGFWWGWVDAGEVLGEVVSFSLVGCVVRNLY